MVVVVLILAILLLRFVVHISYYFDTRLKGRVCNVAFGTVVSYEMLSISRAPKTLAVDTSVSVVKSSRNALLVGVLRKIDLLFFH